ncbi:MAG TPA: hypothetical protein VN704_12035 [Verrucomicrobiae bacterium]|nr:hypothetical protein [Verrucomicrobiae bacterium]
MKNNRERKAGPVGRPFKLDLQNKFLRLLLYYQASFLTSIKAQCVKTYKRLEFIRKHTIKTKRLKTPDEI